MKNCEKCFDGQIIDENDNFVDFCDCAEGNAAFSAKSKQNQELRNRIAEEGEMRW